MWAAIAGIGAHLIVAGLALTVLSVTQSFVYIDNGPLFYSAFAVAAAAGMAVARALGAGRAAVLFALYCLLGTLMTTAQAWLEEERVRSGGGCCFVVQSALEVARWQALCLGGLVIGLILAPRVSAWALRVSGPLEAAGVYALASLPILVLFPVYDPRVTPFLVLQAPQEWHAAIVLVQSALAGLVLAFRSMNVSTLVAASAVALAGVVSVAFADLSTWLHVPLHGWTYWPQSLVFVPLAGFCIALLIVTAARGMRLVRWT